MGPSCLFSDICKVMHIYVCVHIFDIYIYDVHIYIILFLLIKETTVKQKNLKNEQRQIF